MNRKLRETRRRNLEILIKETGSTAKLATDAGTSASYLSQIINKVTTPSGTQRSVGDDLATKLEEAANKPNGWMDEKHSAFPSVGDHEPPNYYDVPTYDEETIRGAFIAVRKNLPKRKKQLTIEEEADIFLAVLPAVAEESNQDNREATINNLINFEERRTDAKNRFKKKA